MQRTFLVLRRCVMDCTGTRRSLRVTTWQGLDRRSECRIWNHAAFFSTTATYPSTLLSSAFSIQSLHTTSTAQLGTTTNYSAAIPHVTLHESTTQLSTDRDLDPTDSTILPITTRNEDRDTRQNHASASALNRKKQTKVQRRFARIHRGHKLNRKSLLRSNVNDALHREQTMDHNLPLSTDETCYQESAAHLDRLLNGSGPISIEDVWQIYANNRQSTHFLYTLSLMTFRRLLRLLEWRRDTKTPTSAVITMKLKMNDNNKLTLVDIDSNGMDPDDYRAQQADRILLVIRDMRIRGLKPPDSAYRALMRDAARLLNVNYKTWHIPMHDMILRKELLRIHLTIFRLKRNALRKMLRGLTEETAYMDDDRSLARTRNRHDMDNTTVTSKSAIVGRASYQQIINMAIQSHQRPLALLAYNDSIYYGTGIGTTAERRLWQLIATRPSPRHDISLFASIRQHLTKHSMRESNDDLVQIDTTATHKKTRNATAHLVGNNNLHAATQIILSFYKDGIIIPVHLLNQLLRLLCEAGSLKSAVGLLAQACTTNTDKRAPFKHIRHRSLRYRGKKLITSTCYPDAISFNTVANAFVDQGQWEMARRIVRIAMKQGIKPTSYTGNIQFKADLTRQMEQNVVDRTKSPLASLTIVEQTLNSWLTNRDNTSMNTFQPDVCTYNICFKVLLMKDNNGLDAFTAGSAAYRLVHQMKTSRITPNLITCHLLLQLFGHKRDRHAFTNVLQMMMKYRLMPNRTTRSILLRYNDASWWTRRTLPPTA
ncbi:hypothetical protein BDF22DRAFT_686257 [Syncephalis plumigaleata]|nr:hypothetical protein BDF22DRAFT_686257 [Syncephalis plumigaleata]